MDHHLAGVVICISGDPRFDKDDNEHIRDQFTDENVSRWLKYRGGELVEEVTEATTHLICSRAAYHKSNPKVNAARKYKCKIVTYEWLTDTFQLWDYQKKKAPPSLYHPGKPRDGDAISNIFRKSEKKAKAVKKQESPAAVHSTAMGSDEGAEATKEAAETGTEQLTISKEKVSPKGSGETSPPKVSENRERNGTKIADDMKRATTPVDKKSGKQAGKLEKSAKVNNQEPPVDLSLYAICKDESGLHQIEAWKPDGHGNERGSRWVLQLYESKSEPKTYLCAAKFYPFPGSSALIRRFSKEASGDKEHEFNRYKSSFRKCTGVDWHQRESIPSKGSFYYLSTAASGKIIGSTSRKNTSDNLEGSKEQNPTGSVAAPHEHRDGDHEASLKRKGSISGGRLAKAFKVTTPSVTSDSNKVTDAGSKTP